VFLGHTAATWTGTTSHSAAGAPTGSAPSAAAGAEEDCLEGGGLIKCPEGHVMEARVSRELWVTCHCSVCGACGEPISCKDASYSCKICKHSLCIGCATATSSLMAGDILLFGPDRWGIHHIVLCCGPLMPAEPEVAARVIQNEPDLVETELFSCSTIESQRQLKGEEFPWYPACTILARRRLSGEITVVADVSDSSTGSPTLTHCSPPVPAKALLHPLRPGGTSAGPPFDAASFREAVRRCAETSKKWSRMTAVTAITARRDGLDPQDYVDAEARAALLEDLRQSWDRRPICSSVAIKVWQTYFELASDGADAAVQAILRWMPVLSDKTAPSALLKTLSTHGWVLLGSLESLDGRDMVSL